MNGRLRQLVWKILVKLNLTLFISANEDIDLTSYFNYGKNKQVLAYNDVYLKLAFTSVEVNRKVKLQ